MGGLLVVAPSAADATSVLFSGGSDLPGTTSANGFGTMVVDAADSLVFTSSPSAGTITALDFKGSIVASFTGETGVNGLALDGTTLYAALSTGAIDSFSATTRAKIGTLATGLSSPQSLVVADAYLWTTSGSTTLARVDESSGTVATFTSKSTGTGLTSDPAGTTTLFSYDPGDSPVTIGRITLSGTPPTPTLASQTETSVDGSVMSNVQDMAVSPDGTHLMPGAGAPYQFDELDSTSLNGTGTVYPGHPYPDAIAMTSADGGWFAGGMSSNNTDNVMLYRLGQPGVIQANLVFGTGIAAHGLAFSPDGAHLFVVYEGSSTPDFVVQTISPEIGVLSQGSNDTTFYPFGIAPNPNGTTYVGKISAVTDATNDYVFVRRSDGDLIEFADATGNTATDLTAGTSGAPGISSSPAAVYDGTYIQVFALAAGTGHLVDYESNGSGGTWTVTDINAVQGGSPTVTSPMTPVVIGGIVHLYTTNSANGDLFEVDNDNLSGHAWNFYDESHNAIGGKPVTGAPGPVLINGVPHVYLRASLSNDLVEFVADHLNGTIWNAYDQTTTSGAPTISSDPIPVLIGTTPHVYLDEVGNGDLVELVADHLNGNIWNAYDQTTTSGAPPLTGDPSAILVNGIPEVFENASGAGNNLVEVAADHLNGNIWNAYAFNLPITGDPTAIIGEQNTPQVFEFAS